MDPAKLKVVELRAELSTRGLDTKGVKAVLVDRLRQALEEETGQEVPETSVVDTSTEDTSLLEDRSSQKELSEPEPSSEPEQSSEPEPTSEPEPAYEKEPSPEPEQPSPEERELSPEREIEPSPEAERNPTPEPRQEVPEPAPKESNVEMEDMKIKQEPEYDDYKQHNYEEKPNFGDYQGYEGKKEHYEADVKTEQGVEVKEEKGAEERKRKRSRWSPQPQKQGWGQTGGWGRKDDEPDLDENDVVLGWYDSDLNLEIDKSDFLEASPMSQQGFGYIWAGCRATYGFNQGKVCYEVKLLENHDVDHLEDEPSPHVLRVGWSLLSSSLLLGEEPNSFGYGGTAKASTNLKFTNYGTTFKAGDTVTAYLDYGDRVIMSFSVNGVYQREAFNITASSLDHQALFPHLLSKNIKFRVNFGQTKSEFAIQPGYTWAANVPLEQRVAGPRRPEKREDCEMLMMCGLPGCGKTTWANKFVQQHPDKFYNILGTNNLIDKMKIQGLPRKRNYHGRWDVLIEKCTKCLNKLLEMAARRRRNYILDQTNVYPSAQKRKMRNFGGFVRRAIVIVPTDEEFQSRCAKREAEEGKDIPDSAVLEMKANFRLPEQGEHFDEVRYIELNEEESRPLVDQYNKEGKAAGFGQQAPFSGQAGKKFRPNDRPPFRGGGGGGGGGGFRGGGGGRGGGGFGGGMDRRDRSAERGGSMGGGRGGGGGFRSGGPPMKGGMDRGGRGGWTPRGGERGGRGGGGGGGGWRDRSPAGYDRGDMDNRGAGGGPWRNNRSTDRDRPYDRNQRGRGGRPGGFDRDNFRDGDYGNRGGGGGYDRDEFPRGGGGGGGYNSREGGGFNNRESGGFRDGTRGGGRGGGNRGGGGFDRDQRGGGRGGFDRRGGGGGFNDRRGGGGGGGGSGGRDGGGFDRNRGGQDNRGSRDSKGGGGNQQDGQGQGWGNQGYNSGWGQGYSNQGQGYNNQGQGYSNQGYNQGYNQQQSTQQQNWGQQGWANKGYGTTATGQQQQQQPQQQQAQAVAGAVATPAATGYNTTGYTQQQAGYNQAQYPQGYWGQYGYNQGWTQNADGTYSYPQGWQQYGYNYGQTGAAVATPATGNAAASNPAAPASK